MRTITLIIFLIVLIFYTFVDCIAQEPNQIVCSTSGNPPPSQYFGIGRFKPVKTLPVNDLTKYLRLLVVFVEFKNDFSDPNSTVWPPMQDPVYMNQVFSNTKRLGLNGYNPVTETISDYWNILSRDQFDVIADIFRIRLPKEYNQYTGFIDTHLDVYRMLDTNLFIDWNRYNLWRWNGTDYVQEPDDYVDMMIIQHRHRDIFGTNYGGFAGTAVGYIPITNPNVQIDGGFFSHTGSGVTQLNGYAIPKTSFMGLFIHEYSHYTLGEHRPYSKVGGDDGTNRSYGFEFALAPQDMISIGYDNTTTVNFASSPYSLTDLITTGQIL
ncbi:MAG: hypothetical protein ACRDFC_10510, partial [Ignavibacteria bacterium]